MRRLDTLFSRLLVAQAAAAVALLLLFGALFYVDRNVTVARLVAQRWAPALRAAAGVPPPAAGAGPVLTLRQATALPPLSMRARGLAPRFQALRSSLGAAGVPVEDLAFSRAEGHPLVWVAVRGPDGQRLWLGFADELVEPLLPLRLLVAVGAGLLLIALASGWTARRLTRPLARLRDRIAAHDPGAADMPQAAPDGRATAEVAAIDAAWSAMRTRLARHERERRLLLAGVSHDLRSPLARIRMAAELLPADPQTAPRRETIVRNVDVADRLLQSFLEHVRAGELPLDETVDLAVLAQSVIAGLDRPAAQLQLEAPATLPLACANTMLLERVLLNLLDNAFRHGQPPVTVRLAVNGDEVRLDVEDAGPGIPPAQQALVLHAFARGDPSRGTPGSGLGLTVVAQVAARLGGQVSFESRPGRHRVRVTLAGRR
jgi:two-component system osmolarity sensor histidine kinase EnvZ